MGSVTNHLRYGLQFGLRTSSQLLKVYEPPKSYLDDQGRKHRKPVGWLYGPGESAKDRYRRDLDQYERYCSAMRARTDSDNAAVRHWMARAQAGDRDGVIWYCSTVLISNVFQAPGSGSYVATAYVPRERHLVWERPAPAFAAIPAHSHYEIGRDMRFREFTVSNQDRERSYLSLLAQVALLTVDRIFRSEISGVVDNATVNCIDWMVNPATGRGEEVCVLSVTVARSHFVDLNLALVDPVECVRSMHGRITDRPGHYAPVRSWARPDELNGTVTTSDDMPLMRMDPFEFEQLITTLLRRMGLRAETTKRSHDNGIDCEAFAEGPVVGGKVIVQVKRYSRTVDPSVVRDLFGSVHATGAMKGVLITTSGFGPESHQFVEGKPLELIDGSQLDRLLRQHQLASAAVSPKDNDLQTVSRLVSPDGQFFWDGAAWLPMAELQAATARPQPLGPGENLN
jgi:restriction system protein